MAMNDLNELLEHELGDMLFAEKTILKALKKMTREVSEPEMRSRMEAHQGETEEQIRNIERAFESMGKKAKAQKCDGILGIIEEHESFKSDEEPSKQMLEAFDLGSGLRVEHYEIAGYRSAIALAKALGEREVVNLLKQNLEQEVAMARFIEGSASRALKTMHAGMQDDMEGGMARRTNGSARGASNGARKTAGKRSSNGRSSSRGRAD